MQAPLRIVVIVSDPTLVAEGDEQGLAMAERSRLLRIGLLEAGYNLVATLPADVFLTERLAQLQGQLRCGTQCGSCVPELRRLIRCSTTSAQPIPI